MLPAMIRVLAVNFAIISASPALLESCLTAQSLPCLQQDLPKIRRILLSIVERWAMPPYMKNCVSPVQLPNEAQPSTVPVFIQVSPAIA